MSVRTRSCLTTTTDQSQKEDSDLLALRDTYTKRLLLLTMMTEQQTCMDAVVDQNFSECSREEPSSSSEMMMMMPADESSCCTSTSFEEWIKTVGFFLLLGRRIHDVSPLFIYYCFLAEPVCTESRAFPCLERFLQPQNKELEKKYMLVRGVLGGYFCYD